MTPPGFEECLECGQFNGETRGRFVSNGGDPDRVVRVTCRCHGTPCLGCGVHLVNKSGSNCYHPEDNTVWHYPWFAGMMPCRWCRELKSRDAEG